MRALEAGAEKLKLLDCGLEVEVVTGRVGKMEFASKITTQKFGANFRARNFGKNFTLGVKIS